VKEDDKFICPICDWRVKIPRDAARPKLEDLVAWYNEIPDLPFQPEEETLLKSIIDKAQDFRKHIAPFCNPVTSTAEETDLQRFYLRKLEGAEILLASETNFFRQELHKWSPVADKPPPVLEESKSTRKPRPTKLQKLLSQYGVDDPDDLPESVRGKANSLKRKMIHTESQASGSAGHGPPHSAGNGSATSPGAAPYNADTNLFSRRSSDQPQTPGLSIASSSHAHPSRGPDSSTSSVHGNMGHSRTNSGANTKDDAQATTQPSFFSQDGVGTGPQLVAAAEANPAMALEERLLQSQMPGEEDIDMELDTEEGRAKAMEILSRTEEGRRKAEELFGDKTKKGELAGTATEEPANEGDVDRMFADMTNQDDEEDGRAKDTKGNVSTTDADADADAAAAAAGVKSTTLVNDTGAEQTAVVKEQA
jgi:[histone H3]-trimethyl-L-lysine4 demethylase